MPTLSWPGKSHQLPPPSELFLDSNIFPSGILDPNQKIDNHLYLGDNLEVMASLLPDYENRINLIYADPPFFTNKNFTSRIGRGEDSRHPESWMLGQGYTDHWENLDDYLNFLYPRLQVMHRLLAPTGSLVLHLDWHVDSYARIMLDEIFGRENLVNQIAWLYHGPSPIRNAFNRKHDTLFLYSKSKKYTFNSNDVRQPYHSSTVKTFASSPKAGFGKVPDLERGKVPEDWWYFPVVARLHNERTGYPTQKPQALLERIIKASSNPGDLVADFFCGSGTTLQVAAQLGRKFLGSDSNWQAIQTTRSRLIGSGSPPFCLWETRLIQISRFQEEIRVLINPNNITLLDPPELDYWEIDTNWNSKRFNSLVQIIRPRKKEKIPLKINIDHMGKRINIRAVTVTGELFEKVLENQYS